MTTMTTMKRNTLITLAVSALIAVTFSALASRSPTSRQAAEAARTFESLKALAGQWQGENAKSEPVSITYEVLADGSAVLERFVHEAHGEDKAMLTVYHLDGDELMLTHYCMAGNQPRMRAGAFPEGAVEFEFVDVTNLASPEAGHMHRATFDFHDENRFSTAWTWRENGADKFTETVEARRVD